MNKPLPLLFVRHGATAPNLAQQRCGGDHDVPLLDVGRAQARDAAARLAGRGVGVIVSSDLQRTRETAAIIAAALGGIEVVVEPGFGERRLGQWNGLPIAATAAALQEGRTPPGGEADADFIARIAQALPRLRPQLARRPLLVASKGVARALGQILGQPPLAAAGNAEILAFDLAPFMSPLTESCVA